MKKLNKTTQKAEAWIKQYEESYCYSVRDFYGSCSGTKITIENDIINKMNKMHCHGYKVLSGNCFHFVCAYKSADNTILYVETFGNTFEIAL